MKNQFVTYEIAKALEELGFNDPCIKYYGKYSETLFDLSKGNEKVCNEQFGNDRGEIWFSAPLWQQAIDWLREKHRIEIAQDLTELDDYVFVYTKYRVQPPIYLSSGKYCKAREEAILKAIEIIKNDANP